MTNVNVDMDHLTQRIRILEAESRAKREQHRDDEERYKLSESAWSGEIVALKVHIKDLEDKLQEERNRNRKLLSEIATRDAEVSSLSGNLMNIILIIHYFHFQFNFNLILIYFVIFDVNSKFRINEISD